jgi:hypothetical protein
VLSKQFGLFQLGGKRNVAATIEQGLSTAMNVMDSIEALHNFRIQTK